MQLVLDQWISKLNLQNYFPEELVEHYATNGFFYWYEELCQSCIANTNHGIPILHPDIIRESNDFATELDDLINDMAMIDCEQTDTIKRDENGNFINEEHAEMFEEYVNSNFWEYYEEVIDDMEYTLRKHFFHYVFVVRTGFYSYAHIVANFPITRVW